MRQLRVTPLKDEELEALFLADYEDLEQDEAARLMNVSRPTFSRILSAARKAVAAALVEGNALNIGGGHFRHVAKSHNAAVTTDKGD